MIELTVIGGYLGAGKTTLLNEILDRQDGERVAVIVNDFGTINIDAEIIGSVDGRAWEIANGCICCDLSDGMAAAIESIRNAEPPVSRVYIEVSGVGRPEVVARWGSHPGFARGGSIVCADVISVRRDVSRKWVGETVASQLRGADRLLLTKTDLVGPEQIEDVRQWLGSQPGIVAEFVDRDQVLGSDQVLGGGRRHRSDRPGASAAPPLQRPHPDAANSAPASPLGPGHEARAHTSWSITTTSAVDPDELRALVLDLPDDFVRVKGVVENSRDPGRRMLVQFDGLRFEIDDFGLERFEPGHGEDGRLVIIAAGAHTSIPGAVSALAHLLDGTVDD